MSHYNVPTLQSNLRGLQKLQQTTHRDREASSTTPTSKEQTDGSKSPLSKSPLFRRKSNPSVETSSSSTKPSGTHASRSRSPNPAGTDRRKYQDTPVEGGASGSGQRRQSAYSKGSKEYKEQKKNPDTGTGTSPGGMGMSTGMSPSGVGTGMSPGGMGMSPDSAPEMSLITVMDLEMSLSQKRYYYETPALDIAESIQFVELEEQTMQETGPSNYAHPFGISTGTSDVTNNPRPKTPPPKPYRKRNNSHTDESPPPLPLSDINQKVVSPTKTKKFPFSHSSRKTPEPSGPQASPKLTRSSTAIDDIGSGLPHSRSEAQLNKSKGAFGNFIDKLKRSPISKRKFSNDDFSPFEPAKRVEPVKPDKRDFDQISTVSEVGPLKTNCPLHNVNARNIGDLLKDPNIDPNARDDESQGTSLHYYVSKPRQSRHTLLYKCLQSGRDFDLNARDKYDNTPLHIAAEKDDIQYIRVLIAFGARLFCKNYQGKFPYQLAPPNSPSYEFLTEFREPLLNEPFTLANLPSEDCTASLNIDELRNQTIGDLMKPQSMSMLARMIDDDMVKAEREFHDAPVGPGEELLSFNSARTLEERSADAARTQQRYYLNGWKKTAGSRVLFLDGGGIRGLVQIEVLMELEERTGCKVTELFDWIVGNSTGGIVALGLMYAGKTLSQMRQLYMQMKSKVFEGAGNFASAFLGMKSNTEKMEKILKTELGDKLLSSVQQPRVMIATVNTECIPIKVQFFTNFMPEPAELYDIPVWKAARATSAAPIFFEPCDGKYVDGGVKANNPCMEALKVIKEYDRSRNHPERHFLLTVSIGTGIYPKQNTLSVDMRKNFWAKWQHLKQLVDMFVDAISDSESAAQGFEEWCKGMRVPIPFYRFSPQLDEAISPGETNDEKLVELIIKTKLYLSQKEVSDSLDKLVGTFKSLSKQSMVGQSLQPRHR